jgi:hypothetical protein
MAEEDRRISDPRRPGGLFLQHLSTKDPQEDKTLFEHLTYHPINVSNSLRSSVLQHGPNHHQAQG